MCRRNVEGREQWTHFGCIVYLSNFQVALSLSLCLCYFGSFVFPLKEIFYFLLEFLLTFLTAFQIKKRYFYVHVRNARTKSRNKLRQQQQQQQQPHEKSHMKTVHRIGGFCRLFHPIFTVFWWRTIAVMMLWVWVPHIYVWV